MTELNTALPPEQAEAIAPVQPQALTTLRASVSDVDFQGLRAFSTSADLLIVAAMRDVLRTPDAQGAAAEAARDCRALASDIRDAGANPTPAGDAWIAAARERALDAVDRLTEALKGCEARFDESDKGRRGAYSRSSSVVMKKRNASSYHRQAPAEPAAATEQTA